MRNLLSPHNHIQKIFYFNHGFTLIELLIAISISAILGTMTFAAFSNFNKNQKIDAATAELVTTLNRAKSNSQSQVKPSGCTGAFYGWWVNIKSDNTYDLNVLCLGSGDQTEKNTPLLNGLSFRNRHTIYFKAITGEVIGSDGKVITTPHVIEIIKNGTTLKTIKVGSYGNIEVL
jgi:prepilin-type N-terminal cleavage/methylation domain-containing protein